MTTVEEKPPANTAKGPAADRNIPLDLAIAFAALLAAVSLCVPFRTLDFHQIDFLDYSWQLVLHWASATHVYFGRDLVFTYGPYGFLSTDVFYPVTFLKLMLIRGAIVAVFVWTLWTIGSTVIGSRLLLTAWLFAIILMIGDDTDVLFVVSCVALFVAYFYVFKGVFSVRLAPLIPLLALLGLAKFTLFAMGGLIVVAIAIDQALRRQTVKAVVLLLGYFAWIVLFWLLAGQTLLDLWPFLRNSLAITRGYTEAMSVPGPGADIFDFLAAVIPLLLVIAMAEWRGRRWRGALPLVTAAIIFFLLFKESFIRHDRLHTPTGARIVFVLAVMFVPALWVCLDKRFRATACICVLTVAAMSLSSILTRHISKSAPRLYLRNFKLAYTGLADMARAGTLNDRLTKQFDASTAELRRRDPLPLVTGSVDMYGYEQALLIAHQLAYAPRPVMQSYAAYSPELSGLNSQRLEGDSAPANLLVDFSNYGDGRFPTLSENKSIPLMLADYEPHQAPGSSKYIWLVRRKESRQVTKTLLSSSVTQLDQPIAIDASRRGPIWVTITVHPTFLWKASGLAYKPPELWIDAKTNDGKVHSYRLISTLAEEGFILSPLIESSQDFSELYAEKSFWTTPRNNVEKITISVRQQLGTQPYFAPNIDVSFYKLDFAENEHRK